MPLVFGFTHLDGILYASTLSQGVYRSIDEGQSWETINGGLSENNVRSIGRSDMDIYAGTVSGDIYKRSSMGGNWILASNTELRSNVGSLCSNNSVLFAGTHGAKLYSSSNGGESWTQPGGIGTVEIRSLISSNQYVFAGTDMLGIYRSSDNGSTFSQCNNGLSSAWFNAFTICEGNLFAGSGEEGVFVSGNTGSSWNSVNSGLGSLNIISLASDGENVFAGTSDAGIFISEDLGINWIEINNGINSNNISSIQYDNESELLYAGTKEAGVFVSSDQGSSWSSASNGLPQNSYIRTIHIFEDKILLGTNIGEIYISDNNAELWIDITGTMVGSPILSLHVPDGYIYAGLNAGGVWKYPISDLVGINDETFSYTDCIMMQNFPNPFCAATTITYQLPAEHAENTEINIFNIKGQRVKQLIIDNDGSRLNEVVWNAESFASGIYYYKLEVNGNIESVRKCLLMR